MVTINYERVVKSDYNIGFNIGICGYFNHGYVGYCCGGEAYNISVDIPQKEKDKLFGHQHKYIKPFVKDTAVQLTTIYGCDSIINLRLVVLLIYEIREKREECKKECFRRNCTVSKRPGGSFKKVNEAGDYGYWHRCVLVNYVHCFQCTDYCG